MHCDRHSRTRLRLVENIASAAHRQLAIGVQFWWGADACMSTARSADHHICMNNNHLTCSLFMS
ncbi:hypothetical protein PILCRDRAFT_719056 [Piloderma croceum F 1598]|uniref:Uncharacterized protein n=1 Tax=Piloderma croceum (strain F 1598) TaxID=765440 RepID=A0A0C3F0Y0_PILCF|nr:hypothetical protein PILCRDRAFT_719056 [Piloderma croceum F 1598]